jgi:hypothetical protein
MLTALIGASGWDQKLSDLVGPTPNLAPTFSSIRAEILQSTDLAGRPTCVNCHRPQGQVTVIHRSIENGAPNN